MKQVLDFIQKTNWFDKLYSYFNKKIDIPKLDENDIVPSKPIPYIPTPVINVVNSKNFPYNKNENIKWDKRNLNKIKKIVIHQTASKGTLSGVNKYHITSSPDNHISVKGSPHICYHYGICHNNNDIFKNGAILKMNNLEDITWHCKGFNTDSIGILVNGNFLGPTWIPKENTEPTDKQIDSLKKLLNELLFQFPKLSKKDIYGHCELSDYKDNCPGNKIMIFLNNFR